MQLSLRADIKKLQKEFSDLSGTKFNQAVVRATNRVAAMTKTNQIRSIRLQYKIKRAGVAKSFEVKKAYSGQVSPMATVVNTGLPLPLYAFNPRKTSAGVSVDIKGKRKVIKSAFIVTMKSGHKGVMARGKYGKKGFEFRNTRTVQGEEFRLIGGRWVPIDAPDLPINELKTLSTAAAFKVRLKETEAETTQFIRDVFVKRLAHELTRSRGATPAPDIE